MPVRAHLTHNIMYQIMTGKLPFEELTNPQVIYSVTLGRLPAIRENEQLSPILRLCSLMSDCWNLTPAKRVDACTFRRKVSFMVSACWTTLGAA